MILQRKKQVLKAHASVNLPEGCALVWAGDLPEKFTEEAKTSRMSLFESKMQRKESVMQRCANCSVF